jgi:hypothetical protein
LTGPLIRWWPYFACETERRRNEAVYLFSPRDSYYYQKLDLELGQIVVEVASTPVKGTHEAFAGQLFGLFAESSADAVVPVLAPDQRLRDLHAENPDLFPIPESDLGLVLPLLPGLSIARMTGQNACFTFHPPGAELLDDVIKVPVRAAEKADILADLRDLGITRASIYPGLEGIAAALKAEYLS